MPGLRNITVELDYVQERPSDVARLECVARAQSPAARGLEKTSQIVAGAPAPHDSTCDWVGGFLWLPGIALGFFLIAAASLAFSHTAALDRKAEAWDESEKERKEQEKKDKGKEKKIESEQLAVPPAAAVKAPEPKKKKARLPFGWLTVLCVSGLTIVSSMWWLLSTPCASSAWPQFVAFADGSFGSKFLPGVFVSFVGWVLLQFWGVMQARQTKRNNDFLEHLQDRARAQRIAENITRDDKLRTELHADIRAKKAALDKEERELPRARPPRNVLVDAEPEPVFDPPDFAPRAAKGEEIKSRILEVVTQLTDVSRLRKYTAIRWRDYWRVADELQKDGLIATADTSDLKDIFRHWPTYLRREAVSDDWKAQIDGFDVTRIKAPAPPKPVC